MKNQIEQILRERRREKDIQSKKGKSEEKKEYFFLMASESKYF